MVQKHTSKDLQSNPMTKSKGKTIKVTGQVDGIPLGVTVDTGTTDTIIAENFYTNMPEGSRPNLYPVDDPGEMADGSPLNMIGCAPMKVCIGSVSVILPVTVADIKDDALLGMDFMFDRSQEETVEIWRRGCSGVHRRKSHVLR